MSADILQQNKCHLSPSNSFCLLLPTEVEYTSEMTVQEFEHIAPSLRDVMLSVGRSFFDNESDADDVAQEGLLALWKYSSRMDADAVHTALAIRIAKHCCMDIVRKRKTTIPMPEDYGGAALNNGTAQSPQEIMEQGELLAAVDNAINRLTPSERRLYELRQIEGLPLDDIVKRTNISKTSVKSMISAARKKIYEELKRNLKRHDI